MSQGGSPTTVRRGRGARGLFQHFLPVLLPYGVAVLRMYVAYGGQHAPPFRFADAVGSLIWPGLALLLWAMMTSVTSEKLIFSGGRFRGEPEYRGAELTVICVAVVVTAVICGKSAIGGYDRAALTAAISIFLVGFVYLLCGYWKSDEWVSIEFR